MSFRRKLIGLGVLLVMALSARSQTTALDSVFRDLKHIDNVRQDMDTLVDGITERYTIDARKKRLFTDSLRKIQAELAIHLDTFSRTIGDSAGIEITDYRRSLENFIDACKRLSDQRGNVGEQNLRSYEDTRFRLLFAKSSILRVLNSYQILINEHDIQREDSTLARHLDTISFHLDTLSHHLDTVSSHLDMFFQSTARSFAHTDSLIELRNGYSQVIAFHYIGNDLLALGYLHFLDDNIMAIGADLLFQFDSPHNGLHDRPTYKGIGGNALFGLCFRSFLFSAGPSLLDVARPADDPSEPFRRQTTLSWNAGITYHYNHIGLGIHYSPLYGSGIRFSYWIKHGKNK